MIRVEMSSRDPEKVPGSPAGPGGPGGPGLPTSLLLAEKTNRRCSHTTVTPRSFFAPKKPQTLTNVAGNVLLELSGRSNWSWRTWRTWRARRTRGDRDGAWKKCCEVMDTEFT